MNNAFVADIRLFEREKGWYYVSVPASLSVPLALHADRGLIAITATVGASSWPTSMLPMGDGTHFIPLPEKVRKREKLLPGMSVQVSFVLRARK